MASQRPRGPRTGITIDPAALRRAREDAGLSLAQVAGSEMTRQAVHLIEAGKVRPTLRTLRLIARRVGVPEAVLLAPPGPRSEQQLVAELERLVERQEHAAVVDQARSLIALDGPPERIAYAHHYLGLALYRMGSPAAAVEELAEARRRFESLDNPWWVAESMDWEAMALHMLEDPRAIRVGRSALRRYRALEPRRPETEARILEHLGAVSYGRRDYARARAWFEAALEVEGGVRELSRMARVYHGLGMCHHGLRDLRPAAELVFKAVTLYEAEQRIGPGPMRMDLPRAENDLGVVLMAQGDLARAEELFLAALEHYSAAGIERLTGHTLLSLGELRQRQSRLDEALDLVQQAIGRAGGLSETYTLIAGHRQLGELRAARGEHDLSDASFQHAIALCAQTGLEERARECQRAYQRVLSEHRQARQRSQSATA